MSLKFYPLFELRDIKQLAEQNPAQNPVFISLIDLKPQQLPIIEREFVINDGINKGIEEQTEKRLERQDELKRQDEQEKIYSNIESMLWISQAIKLTDTFLINDDLQIDLSIVSNLPQISVSVRYLYLPPVSQYMKGYFQKVKKEQSLLNSNSQLPFSNSNSQLPHNTQIMIEERHQVMYCLSRELSSTVLFEFGSKYIRFDHTTFQDYRSSVFGNHLLAKHKLKKSLLRESSTNTPSHAESSANIPYYVVIKSSNYSSEREYQVHRVKLSFSNQPSLISSKSQSHSYNSQSNSISMEIQSKSIISIQKKSLKQQQPNHHLINTKKFRLYLEEITDKLLQLKYKSIQIQDKNVDNKENHKEKEENQSQMTPDETSMSSNQRIFQSGKLCKKNDQGKTSRLVLVKKSSVGSIKCLDYQFIINLLHEHTLLHKGTKHQITLSKTIIDDVLMYYRTCTEMKERLGKICISSDSSEDQKQELMIDAAAHQILQLFTEIFIKVSQNSHQKPSSSLKYSICSSQQNESFNQISFSLIQNLQTFIVEHLVSKFCIDSINPIDNTRNQTKKCFKLSQLLQATNAPQTEFNLSTFQLDLIKSIHSQLNSFIQENIMTLMRNQTLSFIKLQMQKITQSTSSSTPLSYTRLPILNMLIPTQFKQNYSTQLYSHLQSKLSSFNISHHHSLPLIFSQPFQTQHLKTINSQKDIHIHKLNQQIALLQIQLNQKQSLIEEQQSKIIKYKLDQVFYQQIMNELNSTQSSLSSQTQTNKKLQIDLQCTKILNIQANQTIELYKLKQARLLQEKHNFLEAIAHLSKENQHYITLSQQLQSTVNSLDLKIEKYKLIDIEIETIKRTNHSLQEENQSIKAWRKTVEQEHKKLLNIEAIKFNFILKQNHEKYKEKTLMVEKMKEFILELTDQVETKTKQYSVLEDEINYMKNRYFNSTELQIDYGNQKNIESYQQAKFPPLPPNQYSYPLQTR